jgi:CDP-diacylglycerol---serine O-phosphatidyltransferase
VPGAAGGVTGPRRQPRRGMYVLPSLFTAGNIAAGFYAILQSIQGSQTEWWHFDYAALAILVAVIFDGLDGQIARLTNTASDFGREFDSLADTITFGVAPSLLAYLWGVRMLPYVGPMTEQVMQLGAFACFIFLVCNASRLARFNVTTNPQPQNPGRPGRKYFVGMPTPAGAGVIVTVIHCCRTPIDNLWVSLVWIVLILFTGFLMVSRWRFWSGKELNFGDRKPFRLIVLLAAIGAVVVRFSRYALIAIALGYLLSGVLARLAYSWGRRKSA